MACSEDVVRNFPHVFRSHTEPSHERQGHLFLGFILALPLLGFTAADVQPSQFFRGVPQRPLRVAYSSLNPGHQDGRARASFFILLAVGVDGLPRLAEVVLVLGLRR